MWGMRALSLISSLAVFRLINCILINLMNGAMDAGSTNLTSGGSMLMIATISSRMIMYGMASFFLAKSCQRNYLWLNKMILK